MSDDDDQQPELPFDDPDPYRHLDGYRDGITFDPAVDTDRLNAQARRVFLVMADRQWRTLAEIAARTGDPEASVSARLRDFRKPRYGAMVVERRRRAFVEGLWEYRLIPERTVPYPDEGEDFACG